MLTYDVGESVAVPKGWDQKSPLEKLNDVFEVRKKKKTSKKTVCICQRTASVLLPQLLTSV
jgi:hypothetical protein